MMMTLPPDRIPVYLPKSLYEAAEKTGFDMTPYAISQRIPVK